MGHPCRPQSYPTPNQNATPPRERVLAGHLFVFRNKSGDRIKILWWDRDGLAIFYKRLEEGGFAFPTPSADAKQIEVTAADLQLVLQGIDPAKVHRSKRYSRPALSG